MGPYSKLGLASAVFVVSLAVARFALAEGFDPSKVETSKDIEEKGNDQITHWVQRYCGTWVCKRDVRFTLSPSPFKIKYDRKKYRLRKAHSLGWTTYTPPWTDGDETYKNYNYTGAPAGERYDYSVVCNEPWNDAETSNFKNSFVLLDTQNTQQIDVLVEKHDTNDDGIWDTVTTHSRLSANALTLSSNTSEFGQPNCVQITLPTAGTVAYVLIGGESHSFTQPQSDRINVMIKYGTPAEWHDVFVILASGGGFHYSQEAYLFTGQVCIAYDSTFQSFPASTPTVLTFFGAEFRSDMTVTMNGVPAVVNVVSPDQITVTTPTLPAGNVVTEFIVPAPHGSKITIVEGVTAD